MKVLYQVESLDVRTKNMFIADLIGYKLQRDLEATRKLQKLSEDKGLMGRIVNSASQSSSSSGMTLNSVIEGIKTAMSIDIFSFKVNNMDLFKVFQDVIGTDSFELEVYMNPLYFSSEIALKHAVMPGFRKPQITEEYMNERMKRAGQSWLFGFEKSIKDYVTLSNCKKKIIEE